MKPSDFEYMMHAIPGREASKPDGPEYRPTIHFKFSYLPEAKQWKVGQTYKLMLKVKQTSMDEDGSGFEVIAVGATHGKLSPAQKKMMDDMGVNEYKNHAR